MTVSSCMATPSLWYKTGCHSSSGAAPRQMAGVSVSPQHSVSCPRQAPLTHRKATPAPASVAFLLAPQTGFEPVTSSSAGKRSNPLSYWGTRRGGRDLNPREGYSPPTHLAGGRTKPGYATSPRVSRPDLQGGGRGIRTPGDVAATAVFKTAAIVHSAIPPWHRCQNGPASSAT